LTVTAASDIFTQDLEETIPDDHEPESKPKASKPSPCPAPAPAEDPKKLQKRIKELQKELDMTQADLEDFCENATGKRNGFTLEETNTIIHHLELVVAETTDSL
jgi:hypothetical protein